MRFKLVLLLLFLTFLLSACGGPSPEEAVSQTSESVVKVIVDTDNGQKTGAGFFYSPYIVATNYHLLTGIKSGSIVTVNEETLLEETYSIVNVLDFNATLDIALVTVSYEGVPVSIDDKPVETADRVFTIVRPLLAPSTRLEGLVIMPEWHINDNQFIGVTAPITAENTGAPLINEKGKVIGINTSTYSDGEYDNIATPIKAFAELNTSSPYSISDFCSLSNPFNILASFITNNTQTQYYITALQDAATDIYCTYYDSLDCIGMIFYLDDYLHYDFELNADNTYSIRVGLAHEGRDTYALSTGFIGQGTLTGNEYRDINKYSYSAIPWSNGSQLSDMSGYLKEQAYIWMDKLIPAFDGWCRKNGLPCTASDFGLY